MSQRTWLSFIIATLAALVLVFSSFWVRQHHCAALQEMLQPVSHAFHRRQQETFLAKQTAPSKLAVATSEDLPQAMLQSLFVIIYGGSNTQFVFIGISCAKIAQSKVLKISLPFNFSWVVECQKDYIQNNYGDQPAVRVPHIFNELGIRILQLVTCTVRMFQEDLT